MSAFTFEQAITEHDERKAAIREGLGDRILPDEQAGLFVVGSTLTTEELLSYSHGQADAVFADIPGAIAAGVHPAAVIAGYLADAMVLGERIGRKRTEAGV